MSRALTPHQLLEAPTSPDSGPILDLNDIQGDILIGLQKNLERFIFFEITDAKLFKTLLRIHLARRITTTHVVQLQEFELRDHRDQGKTDILPMIGVNIGFTNSGIDKLAPGVRLGDASFEAGAEAQAESLGDPMNGSKPSTWLLEFLDGKIDGVLLVTGGTPAAVDQEAKAILDCLIPAISVVRDEGGAVRLGAERGHEHFGWKDGVSQPGINGLSIAYPGQRMLDPGRFVFGYPGEPSPSSRARPVWMRNGSFMVFRRLAQLVPEFDQFLLSQAHSLGMDPLLLGARLVGRWKSGAPLQLTPTQDDAPAGVDPQRNNNFDFTGDQAQRRCPFGAHIRKTNPREDLAGRQDVLVDPHRIMREGIPFGPEVTPLENALHETQHERGLMFVCYQTSISGQFEFVQSKWANNPGFISRRNHPDGSLAEVGFDPLIGQKSGNDRVRFMDEPVPNYPSGDVRSKLDQPRDFVIPTGGGYFFMPSISALTRELSA